MGMEEDMRTLGAEFLGVMVVVIVFGATGSAMLMGIALAIMTSMAMATSKAHLNPAITLSQMALQRMDPVDGAKYVGAHIAGGIAGMLVCKHVLGLAFKTATYAEGNNIWLTLAAMMVMVMLYTLVWNATVGERTVDGYGGLMVGAFAWLMVESASTGGGGQIALNPAEHLAHTFDNFEIGRFWWYWLGPFLGALLAFWGWDEVMGGDDEKDYEVE